MSVVKREMTMKMQLAFVGLIPSLSQREALQWPFLIDSKLRIQNRIRDHTIPNARSFRDSLKTSDLSRRKSGMGNPACRRK